MQDGGGVRGVGGQTGRRIVYDGWCRNVREHAAAGGPAGASGVGIAGEQQQFERAARRRHPSRPPPPLHPRLVRRPRRRVGTCSSPPAGRGEVRPANAGQRHEPNRPARVVDDRRRRLEGRDAEDPRRVRGEAPLDSDHPPDDRGDRKLGGGVIDAFYAGYDTINPDDSTTSASSTSTSTSRRIFRDADERMEADPRIGTCSGKPYFGDAGTGRVIEREVRRRKLGRHGQVLSHRMLQADRRLRPRVSIEPAEDAFATDPDDDLQLTRV